MARPKLDPTAVREYLDAGHTQADAAIEFRVSEAAISQRVKQLRIGTSKVVALERAAGVVDQQLTAAERLRHVQDVIRAQLDWAEQQAKQPGADRAALSDILVKLSGEVRSQLRLEHDISRTLIDLRVVKEFQRTVFEVISQVSPDTARRIVEKLKEQRALRRSVDLPTLDHLGGFDAARPAG
jgi:hypothetical protein